MCDKGLVTIRPCLSTNAASASLLAPERRSRSVWPLEWQASDLITWERGERKNYPPPKAHLQDYDGRNGFDVEGFCDIVLLLRVDLPQGL